MTTLKELNSSSGTVSLSDLSKDKVGGFKIDLTSSNINKAALTASLDLAGSPESVYRDISTELAISGQSYTGDAVLGNAITESKQTDAQALKDILLDSSLDDVTKKAAADQIFSEYNERHSLRNLLASRTASVPEAGENAEIEFSRINSAAAFQDINRINSEIQQLINAEHIKSDADLASKVADFAEYLVPFYENAVVARTVLDLKSGDPEAVAKAMTFLGSTKQDLSELIYKIPPEKQLGFAQTVAEIVSAASRTNIVSVDENDVIRIDLLNTYLTSGYYTDFNKHVDNIVNILDLVGLGTIIGAGLSGTKAAKVARTAQPRRPNRPKTTSGLPDEFVEGGEDLGDFIFDEASGTWVRPSPVVTAEEAATIIRTRRTNVQPTTPSQILKETAPNTARAVHKAALDDETEELAKAAYGASRADVAAQDRMMEVGIGEEDLIASKISNPDLFDYLGTGEQGQIISFLRKPDSTHFFEPDRVRLVEKVVEDFEQAQGMSPIKEMFQIRASGSGVGVRAVYGPLNGGYSSASDAIELAKWSLRHYGVDDKNVHLLVKDGSNYRRIGKREADAIPNGQFLVELDYEYAYNPFDLNILGKDGTPVWESTEVKRNLFDRYGSRSLAGHGSVTSNLFDISSILDFRIVGPYLSGVDKASYLEKRLLDFANDFAKPMKKLKKDRREKVLDYIKKANQEGIRFNKVDLKTAGFKDVEIGALKNFRDFWDTVYWINNRDYAKTLHSQGYMMYVDEANGTRILAKPVAKGGHTGKVWDLDEGRYLTPKEVADLYENKGTVSKIHDPFEIGEETIQNIKVTNSHNTNYLRRLTDSSEVLEYRPGYFTVRYEDPWFVERITQVHGSDPIIKVVGSAATTNDVKLLTNRLTNTNKKANVTYRYRPDNKKKTSEEMFNENWQLSQARGFSAQRHRGKRLQTTTSNVDDLAFSSIMDPVDAMVSTVKGTADRVVLRDVLDTHKLRVIQDYKDYLPRDKFGNPYVPNDARQVKYRGLGQPTPEDLGAARSHVEYIRSMEYGYVNGIDDTYKAAFAELANILGESGFATGEKAARAVSEARGPSAAGKGAVFTLSLVLHPFRQFFVQSHQVVQLAAIAPGWSVTRGPLEAILMSQLALGQKPMKPLLKLLGMSEEGAREMYKQFEMSGMAAGIDKQNLVRGALMSMADRTAGKKIPVVSPVIDLARKSFDAGEWVNLVSTWLAFRYKAIQDGVDLTDINALTHIAQKSRNYSMAMNRAGDMPYNSNSLAFGMQFQQVPHKALMLALTNRGLTRAERFKYFGVSALTLSIPTAVAVKFWGDLLPDDDSTTIAGVSVRDVMINGVNGALYNKILSMMSGEETYVDWSSLAPIDMHGQYDFIHGLLTGNIGEMVAGTPAGSLFLGENARMAVLAKNASRYFNFIDDFEGEAGPTEFNQVVESFLKLSSGYSAYLRAKVVFEHGQKRNPNTGAVTDPNATFAEGLFQMGGFQSRDEALFYNISDEAYSKTKEFEDDVRLYYKDLKKHLVGQDLSPSNYEFTLKVLSTANLRFQGPARDKAMRIIEQQMEYDRNRGDLSLPNQILRMHGIMSTGELINLAESLPDWDPEKKGEFIQLLKDLDELKGL